MENMWDFWWLWKICDIFAKIKRNLSIYQILLWRWWFLVASLPEFRLNNLLLLQKARILSIIPIWAQKIHPGDFSALGHFLTGFGAVFIILGTISDCLTGLVGMTTFKSQIIAQNGYEIIYILPNHLVTSQYQPKTHRGHFIAS